MPGIASARLRPILPAMPKGGVEVTYFLCEADFGFVEEEGGGDRMDGGVTLVVMCMLD